MKLDDINVPERMACFIASFANNYLLRVNLPLDVYFVTVISPTPLLISVDKASGNAPGQFGDLTYITDPNDPQYGFIIPHPGEGKGRPVFQKLAFDTLYLRAPGNFTGSVEIWPGLGYANTETYSVQDLSS